MCTYNQLSLAPFLSFCGLPPERNTQSDAQAPSPRSSTPCPQNSSHPGQSGVGHSPPSPSSIHRISPPCPASTSSVCPSPPCAHPPIFCLQSTWRRPSTAAMSTTNSVSGFFGRPSRASRSDAPNRRAYSIFLSFRPLATRPQLDLPTVSCAQHRTVALRVWCDSVRRRAQKQTANLVGSSTDVCTCLSLVRARRTLTWPAILACCAHTGTPEPNREQSSNLTHYIAV